MRQAIVILLLLQLFIRVKANSVENSPQPDLPDGFKVLSSSRYEEFMINREQVR